jgi:protein-disulfide isomerase
MSDRLANALMVILTICAVCFTALLVRREFMPHVEQPPIGQVTSVKNWKQLTSAGQSIGPADARVTITEFADYQCPACREPHGSIQSLLAAYPRDVRLVYRHYPLTRIHPQARAAALAAECAAIQGRFAAYHDLLFTEQDSIGHTTWTRFAQRAGVPDTARFARCLTDQVPSGRVDEDIAAGASLRVGGTPTFLINDQLYQGALPDAGLRAEVTHMLRDRTPAAP